MELAHTVHFEDVRIDISGLLRGTWAVDGTSTIGLSIAGTEDQMITLAQGRTDALAASQTLAAGIWLVSVGVRFRQCGSTVALKSSKSGLQMSRKTFSTPSMW